MTVQSARGLSEIRIVGRGGAGVVTAGELLGLAALREGKFAQAIPAFGPERRGALCTSTVRLDDREIYLRCAATRPNLLLAIDPTIWRQMPVVFAGFAPDATTIFNAPGDAAGFAADLRAFHAPAAKWRVFVVDATGISLKLLGRAIPNTVLLGAFSKATGLVGIGALEEVLKERFGERAGPNLEAVHAGFEQVAEG